MKNKGFSYVDNMVEDIIFVKTGTIYEEIVNTKLGKKRKLKLFTIIRQ